ncbi:Uma2 family endonuclease [Kitasatospora acidiphila]|uniref:Uma2 family endonuclease n=1 Tax=Kitasatospora acidiphila TaxID=2567942 RepID=A0A540W419_9ACTN|nr:Uma2 family endonuclease [Kitasatospora acidiphila]TQF03094.1 Uma2 family endonuclease [Kitasatospora acidiphila]
MSIAAIAHLMLPDSPYAMWARGELDDYLHMPNDGTRVEVVGGEIVVSPAPVFSHAAILSDIQSAVVTAGVMDPAFPWAVVQTINLDLVDIGDGYIPDLVLLAKDTAARCRAEDRLFLSPGQLDLVVEVTSKSNAHNDREPVLGRRATKWSGYARCGIPYYLLVDRDPRRPGVTFFTEPDRVAGSYRANRTWKFGDPVNLPEPFGFEINTELWRPWSD